MLKLNHRLNKIIRILQILVIFLLTLAFWSILSLITDIIHEIGHAVLVWFFGGKIIDFSVKKITFEGVNNPIALAFIRIFGGFSYALVLLLLIILIEKKRIYDCDFIKKYNSLELIMISLEFSFLIYVIFGFITGLFEGFYASFYDINHSNILLWNSIQIFSWIIGFLILRNRVLITYKQL